MEANSTSPIGREQGEHHADADNQSQIPQNENPEAKNDPSPPPHPRLRPNTSLPDLLTSVAQSWTPRPFVRSEGTYGNMRLGHVLASVLSGALKAFLCIFCPRWLPSWLITTWLVWRSRRLGPPALIIRNARKGSDWITLATWVTLGAWLWGVLGLTPWEWRMIVDRGVAGGVVGTGMVWMEYALTDGPLGREWVMLMAQVYESCGFGIVVLIVMAPEKFEVVIDEVAHLVNFWLIPFVLFVRNPFVGIIFSYFGYDTLGSYSDLLARVGPRELLSVLGLIVVASIIAAASTRLRNEMRSIFNYIANDLQTKTLPRLYALVDMFHIATALIGAYIPWEFRAIVAKIRRRQRKMSNCPQYRYQPLAGRQIRILILKRSFPGLLNASIAVSNIEDAEYEAISYRWSDPSRREDILVDNARLSIPRSAFAALMMRNSIIHERLIWIDAICINQNDDVEKARQVIMMHDIYHKSSRVLLLPDAASWRSRLALSLLYQHRKELTIETMKDRRDEFRATLKHGWPTFGLKWASLARLLRREYWIRAWIVQEMVAGEKVEIYLGGLFVSWEIFYQAVRNLQRHDKIMMLSQWKRERPTAEAHRLSFISITMINQLRHQSEPDPYFKPWDELTKLESLMHLTTWFDASDERDKVYAFFLLARDFRDPDSDPIAANYSIDPRSLYEGIARFLFITSENPSISLLCHAGCGYPRSSRVMLTWIPNLAFSSRRTFTDHLAQKPRFRASGEATPQVIETTVQNSSTISIKGFRNDIIEHLSPIEELLLAEHVKFRPEGMSRADWDRLLKLNANAWLASAVDLEQRHRSKLGPSSSLEHVLITDREPSITREDLDRWLAKNHPPPEDQGGTKTSPSSPVSAAKGEEEGKKNDTLTRYVIGECSGRRFGITRGGRMCLVPPGTREGDAVVIFYGAQTPYVIRRIEEVPTYSFLIGEAYVQGIMKGEALTDAVEDEFFDLL